MKRTLKSFAAVMIYLLLLCYLLRTEAILLFSPKHIGMFLLGCIILCLPYFERKTGLNDFREIFQKNAIMAGYLETFMLIFVSLNQNKLMLNDLVLNLRPLFYGFVCYMILKENKSCKKDENEKKKTDRLEKEDKSTLELSKLTRQEKQVVEMIRKGLTNREIGEELCISETTVKKHVSNIFGKLEISSRKELR